MVKGKGYDARFVIRLTSTVTGFVSVTLLLINRVPKRLIAFFYKPIFFSQYYPLIVLPQNPSSIENNGLLLDLHNNNGAMAYGIDELHKCNPLAWPGFASDEDVAGFPPTVICVNECDPLRDERTGPVRGHQRRTLHKHHRGLPRQRPRYAGTMYFRTGGGGGCSAGVCV